MPKISVASGAVTLDAVANATDRVGRTPVISLYDCRVEWMRYGMAGKSLLRVTHIPSGIVLNRAEIGLRDDWKLDDALTEIEHQIQERDSLSR